MKPCAWKQIIFHTMYSNWAHLCHKFAVLAVDKKLLFSLGRRPVCVFQYMRDWKQRCHFHQGASVSMPPMSNLIQSNSDSRVRWKGNLWRGGGEGGRDREHRVGTEEVPALQTNTLTPAPLLWQSWRHVQLGYGALFPGYKKPYKAPTLHSAFHRKYIYIYLPVWKQHASG